MVSGERKTSLINSLEKRYEELSKEEKNQYNFYSTNDV